MPLSAIIDDDRTESEVCLINSGLIYGAKMTDIMEVEWSRLEGELVFVSVKASVTK